MSTGISPENEQFLQEAIELGSYASRDRALDEAVTLLKRRDELLRHIDEGMRQLREGQAFHLENDEELRQFFDEIKAEGRRQYQARFRGP
jgi:Arc/MetJ-type ribon-helix-helix transcriptional regulator